MQLIISCLELTASPEVCSIILEGKLEPDKFKSVMKWAKNHINELEENWKLVFEKNIDPKKIKSR